MPARVFTTTLSKFTKPARHIPYHLPPFLAGRQADRQAGRQAGSTVYCRPGTWMMMGNCNASRNVNMTLIHIVRVSPFVCDLLLWWLCFLPFLSFSPVFFPFRFPFPFSFLPGQIHYFLGIRHDAHWCEVMPPQHPRQRSCLRFREDVPLPPPPTTGQATRRQKEIFGKSFRGEDGQRQRSTRPSALDDDPQPRGM